MLRYLVHEAAQTNAVMLSLFFTNVGIFRIRVPFRKFSDSDATDLQHGPLSLEAFVGRRFRRPDDEEFTVVFCSGL